jgi:hypothetical protein
MAVGCSHRPVADCTCCYNQISKLSCPLVDSSSGRHYGASDLRRGGLQTHGVRVLAERILLACARHTESAHARAASHISPSYLSTAWGEAGPCVHSMMCVVASNITLERARRTELSLCVHCESMSWALSYAHALTSSPTGLDRVTNPCAPAVAHDQSM